MCLAHWHAVQAAQAELQRRGRATAHGVLQCIAATAAGFACAQVPGLLAIEPRLQAGLVSALDAPDQASPGNFAALRCRNGLRDTANRQWFCS